MLTTEDNELFTKVGPDTPLGRLMRWYWHPIAAATQLDENPVKRVKIGRASCRERVCQYV